MLRRISRSWLLIILFGAMSPMVSPVIAEEVSEVVLPEMALPSSNPNDSGSILVHLPPANLRHGSAVIICPGGDYSSLNLESEGTATASWFAQKGVAGIVLKYRLPVTPGNSASSPLEDAQAALQMVRQHAAEWDIDPQRVGVLGYSAGGHVAATLGTHSEAATRPNFMLLIYPIITMGQYANLTAKTNLLGSNPDPALVASYSNELQVTSQTPPSFLAVAGDDATVNPLNSYNFYYAELNAQVPAELHAYESGQQGLRGGLGMGIGVSSAPVSSTWPYRALDWMAQRGLLTAASAAASSAPADLTASAGDRSVTLSWTASSGATSYDIYRGDTANGEGSLPLATKVTGTSYLDVSPGRGTSYYTIVAVNDSGASPPSPESSATLSSGTESLLPEMVLPSNNPNDHGSIFVHLPPVGQRNGTAMIVCPGGGYSSLDLDNGEGHPTASWLTQKGIAGIVLKYRLPWITGNSASSPLEDAQAAIQMVRQHAAEWGINPQRVGVLGYSAGGHVASTLGTHFNASTRPDFMLLIYPVITMGTYANGGSRNALLGLNPDPALVTYYSNELQVTSQTPPTFLAVANDDPSVYPQNSADFYHAALTAQVPVELHVYERGAHGLKGGAGYGIGGPSYAIASTWPDRALEWLQQRGLLPVSGTVPPVPGGLTAQAAVNNINLAWISAPGAVSYNLYRGSAAGQESATPIATNIQGTSYSDIRMTPGTYYYEVTAINSAGTSPASAEVSARLYSPAEAWRNQWFGVSDNSGSAADDASPAQDGVSNLLKRALALSPLTSAREGLPTLVKDESNLTLTYTKNLAATDLTYRVEWSDDLTTWSSSLVIEQKLSATSLTELWQAVVPLDNSKHRFLHLRVITP